MRRGRPCPGRPRHGGRVIHRLTPCRGFQGADVIHRLARLTVAVVFFVRRGFRVGRALDDLTPGQRSSPHPRDDLSPSLVHAHRRVRDDRQLAQLTRPPDPETETKIPLFQLTQTIARNLLTEPAALQLPIASLRPGRQRQTNRQQRQRRVRQARIMDEAIGKRRRPTAHDEKFRFTIHKLPPFASEDGVLTRTARPAHGSRPGLHVTPRASRRTDWADRSKNGKPSPENTTSETSPPTAGDSHQEKTIPKIKRSSQIKAKTNKIHASTASATCSPAPRRGAVIAASAQ